MSEHSDKIKLLSSVIMEIFTSRQVYVVLLDCLAFIMGFVLGSTLYGATKTSLLTPA